MGLTILFYLFYELLSLVVLDLNMMNMNDSDADLTPEFRSLA